MSECSRHDAAQLEKLMELSDDALVAYAGIHVSTDSDALIAALVDRVRGLKQEIENWRGNKKCCICESTDIEAKNMCHECLKETYS